MTTKPEVKLPEFPADEVSKDQSETPRVDALIHQYMVKHPSISAKGQADYYEDVHQGLAPLARELEKDVSAKDAKIAALETLLAAAQNEARTAEESLAKVVQQREELRAELDGMRAQAQKPIHEQNARFAIDGAIQYGRMGINKPPAAHHWLMEYWLIGQSLAQPAQEPIDYTDEQVEALIEAYCAENACAFDQDELDTLIPAIRFSLQRNSAQQPVQAAVLEEYMRHHIGPVMANEVLQVLRLASRHIQYWWKQYREEGLPPPHSPELVERIDALIKPIAEMFEDGK